MDNKEVLKVIGSSLEFDYTQEEIRQINKVIIENLQIPRNLLIGKPERTRF